MSTKKDTMIQIEVQCFKNVFQNFFSQEAGAFGHNIEKGTTKPRPKLKKIMYNIYLRTIFDLPTV